MIKLKGEARLAKAQARNAARESGSKHFTFTCAEHGVKAHYTATGRCMVCTAKAKDPAKQAAYWAEHGHKYSARKRRRNAFPKPVEIGELIKQFDLSPPPH